MHHFTDTQQYIMYCHGDIPVETASKREITSMITTVLSGISLIS